MAQYLPLADGSTLYYKDWGTGPAVILEHGWPLSSDTFEDQMLFLAEHGFRVIAVGMVVRVNLGKGTALINMLKI